MGFQYTFGDLSPFLSFILLSSLALSNLIALVIYRIYFHPLSKFPGPFWARISGFPSYLHTLKGDRHVWLWSLQNKYGSSFRVAPNSVLINTPTGFRDIFNNKANVKKSMYYKAYPRNVDAVTTWNSVDRSVHERKRRVLAHAFSEKAMRSAEEFIQANVDRWCLLIKQEVAQREWSAPLNMKNWCNNLVFDILGDLCFGKSFGMMEPESTLRYVPDLMTSFLEVLHPIAFSPFAPIWVWLKPRGLNYLLAKAAPPALKNWETFVEGCFSKRVEAEKSVKKHPQLEVDTRKDFFHYLLRAVDPETGSAGYSLDELYGESEMLIIAGSDTTAITLAASFFYLVRYLDEQDKLAREIRTAFSHLDEIKGGPTLSSCKYLRAFIEEVLRISPPVPSDLEREVCQGGMVVDAHYLPSGVRVSSAPYCLQLNEAYYPEPFRFRPGRWITKEHDQNGSSPEELSQAQAAFCPFSAGPRGCLGKNLAYLEISVILAKIIYQFIVEQEPSNNLGGGSPDAMAGRQIVDQYQLYDIFIGKRHGPMVRFKQRPVS